MKQINTRLLESNLRHPRVNKAKQHTHFPKDTELALGLLELHWILQD